MLLHMCHSSNCVVGPDNVFIITVYDGRLRAEMEVLEMLHDERTKG